MSIFGTNDKLALEIVVTIVALALGALFGILATRRFALGAAGFAIFGVVGFLAALGEPLASPAMVAVQAAVATAVAIQALSWLLGRLRTTEDEGTSIRIQPVVRSCCGPAPSGSARSRPAPSDARRSRRTPRHRRHPPRCRRRSTSPHHCRVARTWHPRRRA